MCHPRALPRAMWHWQVDAAIKEHDSAVDRLLAVKEKDIMQLWQIAQIAQGCRAAHWQHSQARGS